MISHKHKFILISPQKTGTTSVTKCLLKYANYKYINKQGIKNPDLFDYVDEFCNMKPALKVYGSKHIKLRTVRKYLAEKKIDHTKYLHIGMVRNPYSRIISDWKWGTHHKKTLNQYLLETNLNKLCDYFIYNSKMQIDTFIRFENMQEDFNTICDKIGIPKQQLPYINKSKHKHYTEYYDDETREIVAEKYAKDIEYFGYKFGE
tara:strand:+ start:79630 stop:80241 length:612 start_codon:yes stop_codon:yes gene_type:complete